MMLILVELFGSFLFVIGSRCGCFLFFLFLLCAFLRVFSFVFRELYVSCSLF